MRSEIAGLALASSILAGALSGCGSSPSTAGSPLASRQSSGSAVRPSGRPVICGCPLGSIGPTGTVVGRFVAEGGLQTRADSPLSGTVMLTNEATRRGFWYATGADGKFVAHVPPGRYSVAGRSWQYEDGHTCPVHVVVSVALGESLRLTVACEPT